MGHLFRLGCSHGQWEQFDLIPSSSIVNGGNWEYLRAGATGISHHVFSLCRHAVESRQLWLRHWAKNTWADYFVRSPRCFYSAKSRHVYVVKDTHRLGLLSGQSRRPKSSWAHNSNSVTSTASISHVAATRHLSASVKKLQGPTSCRPCSCRNENMRAVNFPIPPRVSRHEPGFHHRIHLVPSSSFSASLNAGCRAPATATMVFFKQRRTMRVFLLEQLPGVDNI